MALVYSYIRYSTKKQMQGDSLRRQVELGETWVQRNNHTLASRTLHDLGISAFKGKNKHVGALSRFLSDVDDGKIPKSSILLVENLDRLSREGMDEAGDLFKRIIKSGVDIATLMPTERVYTRESLKDPIGLLEPLLYFHNAYLESKKKSERISHTWTQKRKRMAAGEIVDSVRPSWVDYDPETKSFRLNDGASAIRYIFQRTAEGVGQRVLTRELGDKFNPIGRSGRWNGSFVAKVLDDRAVLGERQPHTFMSDDSGERIATGDPVPNYYPAVIEEALWFRAQSAKSAKKKMKGPSSGFINLFTGLIVNVNDGHNMQLQTTRGDHLSTCRRLVSYGHTRCIPGSDSVSVAYDEFEHKALHALFDINPADLIRGESASALADAEQELRGIEETISRTQGDLTDPKNARIRSILLDSLNNLVERRDIVQERINALRSDRHADDALTRVQGLNEFLQSVPPDEIMEVRSRLRSAIGQLVKKVELKPEKHYGRVYAVAQFHFHGTTWTRTFFVGAHTSDHTIGTRDGQPLQRTVSYFAEAAKEISQAPERPEFDAVPEDLEKAAELWIRIRRSEMSADSFKTLPSKIHRFLEIIGNHAVDAARWDLFVRTTRAEIRDGRLALLTARVGYLRAREFVTWLQEHGKADEIPEMRKSAAQALQ